MTHDPQPAGITPRYTDPPTVWCGATANPQPAETPPIVVQDGEAARVSVEVCDGYEKRIRELEARLEALENKLDSDIMQWKEIALAFKRGFLDVVGTINKQFGFNTK